MPLLMRPRWNDEADKAVWKDLSGNGNHGTLSGFAFDATSGWAGDGSASNPHHLHYGVASKLRVAKTATFSTAALFGGSWTIDMWFRTGTTGHGYELFNGLWHIPRIYINTGHGIMVEWFDSTNTYRTITGSSALPQNSLLHVAVVTDAVAHVVRIYANGVLVSAPTTWWDMKAAEPSSYYVFCTTDDASVERNLMAFRVYDATVFDAAQVAQNYAAGPTGSGYVKDGLVLDLNAAYVVPVVPKMVYASGQEAFS